MKIADWVGLTVLVGAVGVGGFFVFKGRGTAQPGAPLAGGPAQATTPAQVALPPAPTSAQPVDNTARDWVNGIGAGLAVAGQFGSMFGGLFSSSDEVVGLSEHPSAAEIKKWLGA